ncbi:MAG: manganese efflux pump MntP family protein [candidate division KSB1 bacterium]|nr:manganese efflux pump MntP family protein [candidate division KSB1 bacterium]
MESRLGALELGLMAIALGTDAFSVALGVGTAGVTARRLFRLSWHFGLFQFLMPILGWLMGKELAAIVGSIGHYVVAGFLAYVGARMMWEGLAAHRDAGFAIDRTRRGALIGLSVATSLDALGVGVALGILQSAIFVPAVVIGIVAGAMTAVGMLIGHRLRAVVGRRAEALGGLVLIGLALRFLIG